MDNVIHGIRTSLLSLHGKDWVAEILGSNHKLSNSFSNLSPKIRGMFLYKGQDKDNVFIEHIASSEKFNLTKKSFDNYNDLKEDDTILYLGIVKWKNEWWFSGTRFQQSFNADLVLNEKNSIESRMAVRFLEKQKKEANKALKMQLEAFKDYNNGSEIAFLPSDRIQAFYEGFITFYNEGLNLTKKEIEEANKRARKDGFFDSDKGAERNIEELETSLVFFNPKRGVEFADYVNSAFPSLINPYFRERDSEKAVVHLLMSENLSTELAMYCINNCSTKLSFFNNEPEKKYITDIDFLLRFWKKDNYYTEANTIHIEENN